MTNIYSNLPKEIRRKKKFRTEENFQKYLMKKEYKECHGYCKPPKPIPPLWDGTIPRHHCDPDDYESWVEYGFIVNSEDWTDEDVREWVDEEWVRVTSPYDCSYQTFTNGIHWHRNPCGLISYQHYKSIDV